MTTYMHTLINQLIAGLIN